MTATATRVTKRDLRTYFNRYRKGQVTKIQAERELFGTDASRGKRITRLWATVLGENTTNV